MPLLNITSQIDGRPEDGLLAELGQPERYPTMLFLNGDGTVAAVQEARTVRGFAHTLALLDERDALRGTEGRDQKAEVRLFLVEAELGNLGFEAAQERRRQLGDISAEQAKAADQLLTNLEVPFVLEKHGRSGKTAEAFLDMHEAGRIPSGPAAVDFWLNILYYLQAVDDERYEKMVAALEKAAKQDPTLAPYLERFRR